MYLFDNDGPTRTLLAVLLALPLLSAAGLYLPKRRLSAALTAAETHLEAGQSAGLRLALRLTGLFPAPLRGELRSVNEMTGEATALPVSLFLRAGKETAFSCSLRTNHCGAIRVRAVDCCFTDFLGLFTRKTDPEAESVVYAMPAQRDLTVALADTADFLTDSQRYSAQRPGYDPSETFRIREYRPGDPIRQIHWKLSEKTDRVYVRDFGLPVVERMLLLAELTQIDGSSVTPEDLDCVLSALSSVSLALLSNDTAHVIAWQNHADGILSERAVSDEAGRIAALEELLRAPLSPGNTTVCGCWAKENLTCQYAHAAVFTAYPEPDLELLCHGNRVTLLLPPDRAASLGDRSGEAFLYAFRDDLTELTL